MAHAASESENLSAGSRRWRPALEIALIFLVFFIHGAWPAPEVNEPHYLGKAKHYWDAAWCSGDFFLNTADAHEVFYFAFGWLTLLLPLPAVAWVGRILVWLLLAYSWRRLSVSLIEGWLYSVLSAALFVALNDRFHMAGEWVVGGIEAKGFAYVLVFFGLEALVRDRWGRSLVLFGAAAAFHVVVGGWCVVATILTWLTSKRRPPLQSLVAPAVLGGLLSLGGLWPALTLTWGNDAQTVHDANRLYVYERLEHHLLPEQLPALFVIRHLLLVLALIPLVRLVPTEERWLRLRGFVAAAVAIAAAGMVLSLTMWWQPDFAASLLRYYWFRMSDVMVPLGVALLTTAVLCRWQQVRHPWYAVGLAAALLAAGLHLGDTMRFRLTYLSPRADWTLPRVEIDDWREVCRWASEETPPDAVFLVPRMSQTFRWYAGRGEVVTRKDLPQDAPAIVEWWQRLADIYGTGDQATPADSLTQLGAERLRALGEKYGASYVVTRPDATLDLPRVGPLTRTVSVYQLPGRTAAPTIDAPAEAQPAPSAGAP
jgi:hypothetical protein